MVLKLLKKLMKPDGKVVLTSKRSKARGKKQRKKARSKKSKPKKVRRVKVASRKAKKARPKVRRPKKPKARKVKKKAKAAARKVKPAPEMELVGEVTHYFPHVNAAVIDVSKPIALGDNLYIKGATTDFRLKVTSMQINRVPIQAAKEGDEIGLLVDQRVRAGDKVYKI